MSQKFGIQNYCIVPMKSLNGEFLSNISIAKFKEPNQKTLILKTLSKIDKTIIPMHIKEITIHKKMKHKRITKLVNVLEDARNFYLFLEKAENGDLFKHLYKGKLSSQLKLKIFYQTCEAVKYIHNKNIIHRDIKPENILLDDNMNVKLADFGWSCEYSLFQKRKSICGTIEYMAPEVKKQKVQDKSIDIWSLGILLFEMFHNKTPIKNNVKYIQKEIDNNINIQIKELILKCLNKKPKNRPTIEQILDIPILQIFKDKNISQNGHLSIEIMKTKRVIESKTLDYNEDNLNKIQYEENLSQTSFCDNNIQKNIKNNNDQKQQLEESFTIFSDSESSQDSFNL